MNTSKQLKDLINNKAKQYNLNPQILLTRFFMERFLERISLSKYKNNFVLKGGILISSMVGVDFRMTKDMDLTIKNLPLNEMFIKNALEEISKIKIDDGTTFEILDVLPIREEFEYSGFRARLKCQLDRTQNIIQIDITTGDVITPSEVVYSYDLLIEKRKIDITCYPIETILAEKIESILSKNITTTRMKDFYDCYIDRRNAVSHHKFLAGYKLKTCSVDGFEGCSLIDNIKNLRHLLPERYRYGKNGKGGITAELNKIGIKLD